VTAPNDTPHSSLWVRCIPCSKEPPYCNKPVLSDTSQGDAVDAEIDAVLDIYTGQVRLNGSIDKSQARARLTALMDAARIDELEHVFAVDDYLFTTLQRDSTHMLIDRIAELNRSGNNEGDSYAKS
jgi:hypothetical protein